jgi:hypothetical protein
MKSVEYQRERRKSENQRIRKDEKKKRRNEHMKKKGKEGKRNGRKWSLEEHNDLYSSSYYEMEFMMMILQIMLNEFSFSQFSQFSSV